MQRWLDHEPAQRLPAAAGWLTHLLSAAVAVKLALLALPAGQIIHVMYAEQRI